ncbi:MAG TPA: autotransporter outer membrane beta-barrel domain-containing protein, partial [Alphaproteobacteria bacterium]|nr:autotransporter outer membrane beta-barrel domain-containing protein [Alphaproteobacteria bacterium]
DIIFAQGAKIGLTLDSQLTSSEAFTVIEASQSGALVGQSALLLGNIPYFYNAKIITDPGTGTVSVGLSDRPFSQAGVLGSESAYNAVFKDSYLDSGIRDSFNGAGNQPAFKRLFAQMLPTYSGGLFEVLSQGADALARTQADTSVAMRGDRSGGWAQQFGFGAVDSTSSSPGYHGGGLGFAFGWESPITVTSAWGVSVAYMRASVDDFDTGPGNEQVGTTYTVGAYYRENDGRLHYDASINGGLAEMNGLRNFSGVDLTGQDVTRSASASWLGGLLQAHAGVSYEEQLNDEFYVRPSISGDYFLLSQGSYNERNGGAAFDLAVNSQTNSQGSVTGGVAVGMKFGDRDFMWRPEVMVGYRQIFGGPDAVTAAFAGGSAFTLNPASQKGGVIARIGVHGGNKFSDIAIEAGGEDRDNYRAFDGRIVARFRF